MRIARLVRLMLVVASATLAVAIADTSKASAVSVAFDSLQTRGLLEAVATDGALATTRSLLRQLKKKKPVEEEEDDDEASGEGEDEEEAAPKKKKKKSTSNAAPAGPKKESADVPAATTAAPAATTAAPAATTAAPAATTAAPAATTAAPAATTPAPAAGTKKVNDKRIKGNKKEGVIDHSSEGSAEIDKIDLSNKEGWVSVYNDPPLLVIKASLYAFISYNNTAVCDSFNMTLNAVEQKADGNGTFEYHVVTYVNCTKNGQDETPGRFILNFVPEGRRLLLTECGHREENEILNWLKIKSEVPECMTPGERREFLAQSMKHIHAENGTSSGQTQPTTTNFLARLENLDPQEVAIAGSATVALIAVVAVIVVFVLRKRKAQKDLERTIAGAKADHADEDEDKSSLTEEEEDKDKEKKKDKSKSKDAKDEDEGSFVNSPAVKV